MEFEYNIYKSRANKEKHGIGFDGAKELWRDDYIVLPALTKGESRYMLVGKIKKVYYSCIFTIRGSRIRIISCRRSREKERRLYNEEIKE